MKSIIISGTPGCGKTSVAKVLSDTLKAQLLSLNELAISDKFSFEYDIKRKTYIVDIDIFLPYILEKVHKIRQNDPPFLIMESHFSDIIPDDLIDYVFILRCDPDELIKRLEKKDYNFQKINENVQAEILGNCISYFIQKELKNPLFEIDTSNLSIKRVARIIADIVLKISDGKNFYAGKVDWLEKLFQENRLEEFFD
ncbi:MAG: adenylate kinase family protein [Candidatus Thorarchaeota archaeon]